MSAEERLKKFKPRPFWVRYCIHYIAMFLGSIFTKTRVTGKHYLPEKGPYIIPRDEEGNRIPFEQPAPKPFIITPEMREKFLSTIPLGRFSTPEDIGRAAVYLCSNESSLVTGTALEIDGGRTI